MSVAASTCTLRRVADDAGTNAAAVLAARARTIARIICSAIGRMKRESDRAKDPARDPARNSRVETESGACEEAGLGAPGAGAARTITPELA